MKCSMGSLAKILELLSRKYKLAHDYLVGAKITAVVQHPESAICLEGVWVETEDGQKMLLAGYESPISIVYVWEQKED